MLDFNKNKLKANPIVKVLLLQPKRQLHIFIGYMLLLCRLRRWVYPVAPANYIFWVNPKHIIWHTNRTVHPVQVMKDRTFNMFWDKAKIIDGDWDTKIFKYDDLAAFRAIKTRILNNTPWKCTDFFFECMSDIKSGRHLWGCVNETALLKRLSTVDQIISNMKLNGYKVGYESCLLNEDTLAVAKHSKYSDEITINIGRNGDFYFQDGRHRLAIAKVLGIKRVPVKVLVRHLEWCQKLKNISVHDAEQQRLLEHPDINYLITSGGLVHE